MEIHSRLVFLAVTADLEFHRRLGDQELLLLALRCRRCNALLRHSASSWSARALRNPVFLGPVLGLLSRILHPWNAGKGLVRLHAVPVLVPERRKLDRYRWHFDYNPFYIGHGLGYSGLASLPSDVPPIWDTERWSAMLSPRQQLEAQMLLPFRGCTECSRLY